MGHYQDLIAAWLAGTAQPAPIADLVGFALTALEDGVARVEMEVGRRHHNPMGVVHGGVFCDLADAAMGVAFAALMEDGETFSTVELSTRYVRPVREGRLVARARVVHRGRTVGHLACEITDGEGRVVAHAASTCLVVEAPSRPPSA
jgi:uncharacterized protein (TIGR00369 family)